MQTKRMFFYVAVANPAGLTGIKRYEALNGWGLTKKEMKFMRTLAVAFLVTLIVITIAPAAISAGDEQVPQARTHNDDHNTVLPHAQVFIHNDNGHGHPHSHNVFQRLHYALFGRYHLDGTCTAVDAAPASHNKTHGGHQSGGGVKHGPAPHGR